MVNYNFKPKDEGSIYGWYERGYIPHFDGGEISQFITFRLCDSMPREKLEKWRSEVPDDIEFRKDVEKYLDSGFGECRLKNIEVALMIQDSLLFHHARSYKLTAWVIAQSRSCSSYTIKGSGTLQSSPLD